jgi:hypothetical protein
MLNTAARGLSAISILAVALTGSLGHAQVTITGLRGIVRDTSDAVVPNVAIKVRDTSTGIEKEVVSGADGGFLIPNLLSGTYSLTASLAGFQTATISKIVVDTGRTTDIEVQLKIGSANETVEVSGTVAELATSTNEVGKTIDNKSILNVPLPGRETLNFALLIPGVGNTQGNDRYSTFNGLPNASMDITVDGMNNNSQRWKSGGTSFYEFGPSRIDAMEQVTVSTTGLGADAGGQGAMQIRMTTKRGTDTYHFKVLEQLSNEDFNANTYFNTLQHIVRPRNRQNNEVGYFSGQLLPFVPRFKHKLYFFAYFEAQPQPASIQISRNILTPDAQAGRLTYLGTDGQQHTVNLLTAASQAGLPSTIDPTVAGILSNINATQSRATNFLTAPGQPYYQQMLWNVNVFTNQQFPAARLDYLITPKIGYHGSWNLRHSTFAPTNTGSSPYPGTGYDWNGASTITTYVVSNQVDWTITPHMINNFTFGIQSNLEAFNPGGSVFQWAPQGNRIISAPNNSAATALVASYIPGNVPENRNNPVFDVVNNFTWIRDRHTFTIGGSLRHTTYYDRYWSSARPLSYNLGISTSDPAYTTIQSALPAINTSNGDVTNALALYAYLTGRLSSITGSQAVDEKTHQYVPLSPWMKRYLFNTGSLFFQDSFRLSPNFTLNYGLRWQLDGPISTTNGVDVYPTASSFFGPSYGNFQPGVLTNNLNPVYGPVQNAYKSDLKNPAPNLGFAWNPSGGPGLLGKIIGDRKTVIRGSYAINFYNEGLNDLSFLFEANQNGSVQSITSGSLGSSAFPFGTLLTSPQPALVSNPPSFNFPMPLSLFDFNSSSSIAYANPKLVSPYVQNWTVAIQRQLPSHTILEVRYVGNKSTHMWHYQNVSETNIFENGFLKEFQNAQTNLAIANGLSLAQLQALPAPRLTVNNFANTGLPGQVALPIFERAFGANGSNIPLQASQGFGSSTFITQLEQGAAGAMAATLAGNSGSTASPIYYCRLVGSNFAPCAASGLGFTQATPYPMNFFTPNPFATRLNYLDDNGNTNYNGLQVQVRKSMSHGLFLDLGYTWSKALGTLQNATDSQSTYTWYTMRNGNLNYGPIPFDHRHTFTAFWTYDLPIGKGKALNLNNRILDRLLGEWVIGGVDKIISGYPTLLTGGRQTFNNLATSSGVTFGSGMTLDALRDRLTNTVGSYDASCTCFHTNVSDILLANGSANPAYFGPASTPGQFGDLSYIYTKTTYEVDFSLNKDFRITERLRMGVNFQVYNALNHPFLPLPSISNPANLSPTATTFGNVTSATGNRTGQLRAYVSW